MNLLRLTAGTGMALSVALLSAGLQGAETKGAAALRLSWPLDYQVHQRVTRGEGTIMLAGSLAQGRAHPAALEARLVGPGAGGEWAGEWREVRIPGRRRCRCGATSSA